MLAVGFIDIVRESTALAQMLSTSAWHIGGGGGADSDGGEPDVDYARYSVVATRSLRQKLSRPTSRASDEVVVAVLAFAAYAVRTWLSYILSVTKGMSANAVQALISDPGLIGIHLDGLSQVLGHRGGLMSVESMPVVRIMIFW